MSKKVRKLTGGETIGYWQRMLVTIFAALISLAANVCAESLQLPAVGAWNGFHRHLNVLECSNASGTRYDFVATIRSNQGGELGSQTISLPPFASIHIPLNAFPIADAYGTVLLEHLSHEPQATSPLNCATVMYRLPAGPSTKAVEYAFALPVRNPLRGNTSGVFNSFSPSGGATPVSNWLSVVNSGATPFSASVEVYFQDGTLDSASSFFLDSLQPGERRDFALGHPFGQRVGLYRIIPASADAPYGAFTTRYSTIAPDQFNFAFPVFAESGSCDPGPIPASTMDPAMNWGEVANASDTWVPVSIEVRDGFGGLKYSEQATIPPRSQKHVYINSSLGESTVGTFRVKCNPSSPEARLLVDSAYYGFRFQPGPSLEWAYVSQARSNFARENERISFPLNTFFGAANWAKFLDSSGAPSVLTSSLYDLSGRNLKHATTSVIANGGVDLGLHADVGSNFAGQVISYSNTPGSQLNAELLRVFPDSRGGLGYVMNLPAVVNEPTAGDLGPLRAAPDGPFFEFRGKKIAVVGESVSQGWMELGSDFQTNAYLDHLHARGVNALMIWSYIAIVDQAHDARIGYNAPRRWPWVETSGRSTPPYQFQLVDGNGQAIFNEAYFNALRDLVQAANARDMMVLITIHDGWTKDRFAGHPMNQANGGALARNSDFVTLASYTSDMPETFNAAWTPAQKHQFYLERFTDKLIRSTADSPNVTYELFNEGEWYDATKLKSFESHVASFIRARTDLPIVLNDTGTLTNDYVSSANVDAIAYHSPNWNQNTRVVDVFRYYADKVQRSGRKPVLFDEPVPSYGPGPEDIFTRNGIMRLMWGTLLGGAGFFVPNDVAWKFPTGSTDPIFDYSSAAANFFNNVGIPIEQLAPSGSLSSNGVCSASPGNTYIVYTQAGGQFTLNLTGTSGTFSMKYFSPRTGVFYPGETPVSGGAVLSVTPPSADDWVVWLRRTS